MANYEYIYGHISFYDTDFVLNQEYHNHYPFDNNFENIFFYNKRPGDISVVPFAWPARFLTEVFDTWLEDFESYLTGLRFVSASVRLDGEYGEIAVDYFPSNAENGFLIYSGFIRDYRLGDIASRLKREWTSTRKIYS